MVDESVEESVKKLIDQTKKAGDTIGGVVEVRTDNVPAGLGSYPNGIISLMGKSHKAY